jgi:DNA-3-methyladenine glycosylase II
MSKTKKSVSGGVVLRVVEPYDFALCLRVFKSFQPAQAGGDNRLQLASRIAGTPTLIEIYQGPKPKGEIRATGTPGTDNDEVRTIAEWVLFAELDLQPFYKLAARRPKQAAIVRKLHGLKPTRPVSLFEMAVVAITEQQISLAAAYHIRSRLVEKFGVPINEQWIFPEAAALAEATPEELRSCGLSRQKSEYIRDLAGKVSDGRLDLDELKSMNDEEARERIMEWKGFGRWSADYILVRGLARPDCVPVDDIGIRSVVGEYLGNGERYSSDEVSKALEPFRPYRGLMALYLLAEHRLARA